MTDPPATAPDPSAAAVVRAYLGSFSSGDPERIAAHVTDDFVNVHTAALGAGCTGRSAYRDRLAGFLAEMVDLHYLVEDLIVDGDRVAAFYTMTASWQGATPISIRGVQRFEIAAGRIAVRTDYWDSAVFLVQADPAARVALAAFGIRPPGELS